jgi:acetyl esterase/lipase
MALMKVVVAILLFGLCVSAQSIGPPDLWKLSVPAVEKTAYGQEALQFGELRVPKAQGAVPVVVLIHGGCWATRLPSRDSRDTSLEPLRPLAAALTDAGVATWNVEYRRAGDAGGGWPGSYQDLATGVDFIRTLATSNNLDLNRVVVVGHSSGGQLAHWVAARRKLPRSSALYSDQPLPIKAAVNVDGPPDLATAQPLERKFCPIPAITDFIGGSPAEERERYEHGAAMAMLPLGVPQTIVVGGLLRGLPTLVTSYNDAASSKGDTITIMNLENAGHFDMLAPATENGKSLIAAILALLR